MYAITGISGKVGGALARALLHTRQPVRAVLRDQRKAAEWAAQGCDIAFARMDDATALAAAFDGCKGVFILPPPQFDPAPGFPEMRRVIDAVMTALRLARPDKVESLSTIGAQVDETNLLSQLTLMEQALSTLPLPVTVLRPAWFMDNFAWDIDSARNGGVISTFLQPLDRPVPMVATRDVGMLAARLLQQEWHGHRIVELEGQRVSPNDAAAAFTRVLGRPVAVKAVPRETWAELFTAQGMKHPLPRIRMLDGFNEGWIKFEDEREQVAKGPTDLETVLRELVARTS
jgi:uncharacterized protein YbjT (DUF2867 family)